jgi:hypothetical protein
MNDNKFYERYGKRYSDIINECDKSESMCQAAKNLGIPYKTFARVSKKLGCFKANQAGKGMKKHGFGYSTTDILDGKYPQYNSYKLKLKLYKEGIKENRCEICGINEWQGKKISLHLDHINGNNSDHRLENLRILCPNCHSQTPTYSQKKRN